MFDKTIITIKCNQLHCRQWSFLSFILLTDSTESSCVKMDMLYYVKNNSKATVLHYLKKIFLKYIFSKEGLGYTLYLCGLIQNWDLISYYTIQFFCVLAFKR